MGDDPRELWDEAVNRTHGEAIQREKELRAVMVKLEGSAVAERVGLLDELAKAAKRAEAAWSNHLLALSLEPR